ncbi:MAG: hypothetical protein H7839_02765, partial [Magnetococcus sp. YQC-5]
HATELAENKVTDLAGFESSLGVKGVMAAVTFSYWAGEATLVPSDQNDQSYSEVGPLTFTSLGTPIDLTRVDKGDHGTKENGAQKVGTAVDLDAGMVTGNTLDIASLLDVAHTLELGKGGGDSVALSGQGGSSQGMPIGQYPSSTALLVDKSAVVAGLTSDVDLPHAMDFMSVSHGMQEDWAGDYGSFWTLTDHADNSSSGHDPVYGVNTANAAGEIPVLAEWSHALVAPVPHTDMTAHS